MMDPKDTRDARDQRVYVMDGNDDGSGSLVGV